MDKLIPMTPEEIVADLTDPTQRLPMTPAEVEEHCVTLATEVETGKLGPGWDPDERREFVDRARAVAALAREMQQKDPTDG